MPEIQSTAKRQTAIKIWISDLKAGKYYKTTGEFEPNYVLTSNEMKVSRVNIMGIVLSLDDSQFMLDDGSSQITVRSFDKFEHGLSIGDIALLIGRVREFSSEIYILPEIVKKLDDSRWLELRKLELGKAQSIPPPEQVIEPIEQPKQLKDPFDAVIVKIKELDKGDGADIEDIIAASGIDSDAAENIINNLLMDGEAFEIKPGRLKLLD